MIFSSHRFEEVVRIADRVLVMQEGKVIADCPPSQLHQYAGWKEMLRLYVPDKSVDLALEALNRDGFNAFPNGRGIWVQVLPGRKGEPIETLHQAGIQVKDFELEHLDESEA